MLRRAGALGLAKHTFRALLEYESQPTAANAMYIYMCVCGGGLASQLIMYPISDTEIVIYSRRLLTFLRRIASFVPPSLSWPLFVANYKVGAGAAYGLSLVRGWTFRTAVTCGVLQNVAKPCLQAITATFFSVTRQGSLQVSLLHYNRVILCAGVHSLLCYVQYAVMAGIFGPSS